MIHRGLRAVSLDLEDAQLGLGRGALQLEAFAEMTRIMEDPFPLPVPLKVDVKRGEHWGAFKED